MESRSRSNGASRRSMAVPDTGTLNTVCGRGGMAAMPGVSRRCRQRQ